MENSKHTDDVNSVRYEEVEDLQMQINCGKKVDNEDAK